jgi:hypothetical protein
MYIKDKNYNPLFDKALVVVDIVMIFLVIINLIMLGIQMNFENESVREFLKQYAYPFYEIYFPVYRNFFFIDMMFVTVFVTELLIRWSIAIYYRTYYRWFFYPFANLYDVLGCIPVGTFRLLRIFRIVSIVIRLNRMKVIDIRQWHLYKLFTKYMNVLTEEISDRVVVNVIEGVQDEIGKGIPLTERIVEEVIVPRKDVLVSFVSHRVQQVTRDQYSANKEQMRESIRASVTEAIKQNRNIKLLEQVPVFGAAASAALQQSVYDITFQTINNVFEKLASDESRVIIEKITDGIIESVLIKEEDTQLQKTFTEIIIHSLELVKEQVKVQNWKEAETKPEPVLE